jgi:hypothetical protein
LANKGSPGTAPFSSYDMRIPGMACLMTVYKRIFVNIICDGASKVPVVYEKVNLQSWILYMSINLVMPICLKSGVVGASYPALHIFLIDTQSVLVTLCHT